MTLAICAVAYRFFYSPTRVGGECILLRNTASVFGNIGIPVDCLEVRNL